MRRYAVLSAVLALVGSTFAARGAVAQGFGVYEHDACMMGRAGTGVAGPCSNAAAIFANPAGIVNDQAERKWNVSLGVTMIAPTFSYTDSLTGGGVTDAVGNTIPVPNFFAVRQLGKLAGRYPWAVGIGVMAPYGLISEWPDTFEGRFLGYYSELKSVYIQPTAAVQFNSWLSVGAGFDYIHSSVHLNQRADLAALPTSSPGVTFGMLGVPQGTDIFNADLTGSSWSGTGHFGVLITTERVNVGIRYLMRATADIQGEATFDQLPTGILLPAGSPLQPTAPSRCVGIAANDTLSARAGLPLDDVLTCNTTLQTTFGDQHASVPIALPDQLVIGTSVQATEKLRLLFDMQFTNWQVFEALALTFQQSALSRTLFEDYNSTVGLRFGAEYRFSPSLTVRGGGLIHEAAAPSQTVTPLLPEAERSEATLGASIRIGRNGQLDFAYQKIWQADRRGRVVEPTVRGPAGAAVNAGIYGGGANLFGANLVWRF